MRRLELELVWLELKSTFQAGVGCVAARSCWRALRVSHRCWCSECLAIEVAFAGCRSFLSFWADLRQSRLLFWVFVLVVVVSRQATAGGRAFFLYGTLELYFRGKGLADSVACAPQRGVDSSPCKSALRPYLPLKSRSCPATAYRECSFRRWWPEHWWSRNKRHSFPNDDD